MKLYAIKRPKHSSSVYDETKQDIISKLPGALLIRVLSLLPDDDACRTSILSKRWRDVWMFLPNLRLIMPLSQTKEQIDKFYDLVDKTLAIRDGMPIQKFSLSCSEGCDYDRVYRWLCVVVQCEVETLFLKFPTEDPIQQVDCFWDLFKTCNTLVDLTLEGGSWLSVPKADVLIPCLKKIRLNYCYWPRESLNNLIMGCPVLEEMSLVGYELTDQLIKLRLDSSQYFTRIRICSRRTAKFEVVIHVYHYMHDYCIFPPDIVQKPLPFVEVYDLIINNDSHDYLFSYITRAKILTLTDSSLEALVFKGLHKRTFSNVVKLMIDNISTWNSLLVLLNSVPNLEHITFSEGILHTKMSWISPMEPPACLHLKLKEIIILNRKTISYEEFTFVRYMLEHSKNLERLRINAHVLDPMRHKQLLNFHRGLCRIEIV